MMRIEGVVFGMCPILHLKDVAFIIELLNIFRFQKVYSLGTFAHCDNIWRYLPAKFLFVITRLPYLSCA